MRREPLGFQVVLALPDGAYRPDTRYCACTAPCEYIPDPLGCPGCVAKGYAGQACSPVVVGVDGPVEGVLLELDVGICYCEPALAINNQCNYESNSTLDDRRTYPRAIQDDPYDSCNNWDLGGVLVPLAEPVGEFDCECQHPLTCQCPPGILDCKYTGQSAGDSCTDDFGSGNLVQDEIGACACAIPCTLQSPECTRNCDTYTGERCTLQGGLIEGVATGLAGSEGECFCQVVDDCPSSTCFHRDGGCVPVGTRCTDDLLQTSTLNRSIGGVYCKCENVCLAKTTNGASSQVRGAGCAAGLLGGIVVESHPGELQSCRCQLQNCSLSSCEGDGCETFEGEFGEPCDDGKGVITVDKEGNCKCAQNCVNVNCPVGAVGCTPLQGRVGDQCTFGITADRTGLLTPGGNPGECICSPKQCRYEYRRIEGVGENSGVNLVAHANPGDTCHDRARIGVVVADVTDPNVCTCETGFENNRCYKPDCEQLATCSYDDKVLGDRCITSTGFGEFALARGSETVCECQEEK
uniref:4Fe-4S ferredoxin-type domain-containing protein n=1 Tax=Rhodosorus marinus TaxID=101924 RepID=A0A7S0BDC5_9RHOD|mmetsp:Transcript_10934/g.15761  ORF Transcript_10934/g.15761 Transcript_10934/m.15761 type:complete len:522 (+) Transcript_10934:1271-2836(+)